MKPATREQIDAHAIRSYPRECCGVVAIVEGQERYFPCRNMAKGTEHFVMHPEDLADAEDAGELVMIVHSHPNATAQPSQGDRVSCELTQLPWMIVAVWKEPGDPAPRIAGDCIFEPCGYEAPLVGREFFFGVLDCYTLVRDWYKRERGIVLPDFERRDNFWKEGIDLYAQYEKAGFVDVTGQPLQVGDGILMQIRCKDFANHAGVYVGDGMILHHLMGRLSSRDPYYHSQYHKNTLRTVRYVG